jgi:hypothetical protein
MPRRAHPVRSGRMDVEAVFSTCWTDKDPIRVVSLTAEHWSQDRCRPEVQRRCDVHQRDVPFFLENFVDPYALCLSTAFRRRKPAAVGVKAPYPGFIELKAALLGVVYFSSMLQVVPSDLDRVIHHDV